MASRKLPGLVVSNTEDSKRLIQEDAERQQREMDATYKPRDIERERAEYIANAKATQAAKVAEEQRILQEAREAALYAARAAAIKSDPALLAAEKAAKDHIAAKREAATSRAEQEQRARDLISSATVNEDNQEGFWEYNQFNEDLDAPELTTDSSDLQKIKDTVHQKIFIEFIRTELKRIYNCEIICRRKNGRYAMFIIPNDTNYMINITNGISNNQERIFFNLSLKQADKTKKIRTEYISEYFLNNTGETPIIYHEYEMKGVPPTLKKNSVNLNDLRPMENPYLMLNDLLKKYFGPGERVNISSSLDLIKQKINTLNNRAGRISIESASLKIINDAFKTEETKTTKDDKLKEQYKLFERFAPSFLRDKGIEDLNVKIPNEQLFITNNGFTEMLAFRYASYIPDFEFTKSCNGKYTYTDPFPFKLAAPFTATDIYLHRFDRHFNYDYYAMDRYDINTPSKLQRLADLVELSKSLMMSFISISYDIYNNFKSDKSDIKLMKFSPIYQGLVWNINKTSILNRRFSVSTYFNRSKLKRIIISFDLGNDKPGEEIKLIPVVEIPYIGKFDIKEIITEDKSIYKNKPVVSTVNDINSIEIRGVERFIMNKYIFDDAELDKLYKEFFNLERGEQIENLRQSENFLLNTDEFPQLNANMQGVIRLLPEQRAQRAAPVPAPAAAPTAAQAAAQAAPAAAAAQAAPAAAAAPLASAVLRTNIPLAFEISEVLVNIRQIKTPIRGETRKQRGERLKRLTPVIERLNKLRQEQLEEIKQSGKTVPPSVLRQTRELRNEGLVQLSRPQQRYKDIEASIETNRGELLSYATEIRQCENDAWNSSKTKKDICDKMKAILEKKRELFVDYPRAFLATLSERSVNNNRHADFLRKQSFINATINSLIEDIKLLKIRDEEEQRIIIQNRESLMQRTEARQESAAASQAKQAEEHRLRIIEDDNREIEQVGKEYADLQKATKDFRHITINMLLTRLGTRTPTLEPDSSIYRYIDNALKIAENAVRLYGYYDRAIFRLADARSRNPEEKVNDNEMEKRRETYIQTRDAAINAQKIFDSIVKIFNKPDDEILIIADESFLRKRQSDYLRLGKGVKVIEKPQMKTETTRDILANVNEQSRTRREEQDNEDLEILAEAKIIVEGLIVSEQLELSEEQKDELIEKHFNIIKDNRENILDVSALDTPANDSISIDNIVDSLLVRTNTDEKGAKEAFDKWKKLYDDYLEQIRKSDSEINPLKVSLNLAIKKIAGTPKKLLKTIGPVIQQKISYEQKLSELQPESDKLHGEYKKFLVKSKSLIETNKHFIAERATLLDEINKIMNPPTSKQKYLKYKYKYLQLKQKIEKY